jgi:hypothetical protein
MCLSIRMLNYSVSTDKVERTLQGRGGCSGNGYLHVIRLKFNDLYMH